MPYNDATVLGVIIVALMGTAYAGYLPIDQTVDACKYVGHTLKERLREYPNKAI